MDTKSNRELELEKVELSISAMEDEIVEVQKYVKAAKYLAELECDEGYQFVVEQMFIAEESDRLTGFLVGDQHLSDDDVKAINDGLKSIRAFKALITNTKQAAIEAPARLARIRARIAEENMFKADVMAGNVDVGDSDE